jgi:DNA-binding response OmpR family regulator
LPALPASQVGRPACALLVERDADTREMYGGFLRQCGFDVEEAQDGPEGLAKAFSCHPHVIITSTRLAGMSGFDLCRLLRADHLTSSIPIVVVTSETGADLRRARSAGADSILPKPCSPNVLFREVNRLLLKAQVVRDEARQARPESDPARMDVSSLLDGGEPARKRVMLNHVHGRHVTKEPTTQPPALVCPNCYEPLRYTKSYIGGVSARHPEQWDYFECRTGCGAFQYRHRTRKLRQIG